MKRALLALTIVLSAALLGAGWGWLQWTRPGKVTPGVSVQHVRVRTGTTMSVLADTLRARGILRDRRVLLLGARLAGKGRMLQAGTFEVPAGIAPRELLELLTEGRALPVRVTIPEGLSAAQTAELLAGALGFSSDAFLAAADQATADAWTRRESAVGGAPWARLDSILESESLMAGRPFSRCEGYLAPDTYFFVEGTSPAGAADLLVRTQLARIDSVLAGPRPSATAGLNPHQLLTLASIIEAETGRADERAKVASVYANRLNSGWRLEADPTVAYALGKKGQRLLFKDLEIASAFNTYKRDGLPPGPIGSPGLAAITASARPDSTCLSMFFVADGSGGHVFSVTAAQHSEAVRRFRVLREAGAAPSRH